MDVSDFKTLFGDDIRAWLDWGAVDDENSRIEDLVIVRDGVAGVLTVGLANGAFWGMAPAFASRWRDGSRRCGVSPRGSRPERGVRHLTCGTHLDDEQIRSRSAGLLRPPRPRGEQRHARPPPAHRRVGAGRGDRREAFTEVRDAVAGERVGNLLPCRHGLSPEFRNDEGDQGDDATPNGTAPSSVHSGASRSSPSRPEVVSCA